MNRQIKINYHWTPLVDKNIPQNLEEDLENLAMDHIFEMIKNGFNSGELNEEVHVNKGDLEEMERFSGWWSVEYLNF